MAIKNKGHLGTAVGTGANKTAAFVEKLSPSVVDRTLNETEAWSILKCLQGQQNWPHREGAGSHNIDDVVVAYLMTITRANVDWLLKYYRRDVEGWPTASRLKELLSKRDRHNPHFGPALWGNPFGL